MGKIKKNFLYSVAYQILAIVLPLITSPYISRVLHPNGVGQFSYTNSIVNYFVLAGMLGMTNLGNRSIAEVSSDIDERSRRFFDLYLLQFISFLVVAIAYILYLLLFSTKYKVLAIIQIFYILAGMLDIGWFFCGLEQIKITVVRNALVKIIAVFCVFVFVKHEKDIWLYTLIMSLGTFLSQIFLWRALTIYVSLTKPSLQRAKSYVKQLFIYFIPVIAYSIYKLMDKVMLGIMTPIEEVGYYENALKIVNVPMGVINALGTVMLPRITVMRSQGNDEGAKRYIKLSFELVTFISAAICFGLIAVADLFAILYFGIDFANSGPLIAMLSFTCIFIAWASVSRTQYLIPYKKDKIYTRSTVMGAIINVLINSILIPHMGARGAAYGTIAAEFSVMFIQVLYIKRELPILKYIGKTLPYIVNGICMLVFVRILNSFLPKNILGLCVEIVLGGSFYIILSIIFIIISQSDIYHIVFKNYINRIKKTFNGM